MSKRAVDPGYTESIDYHGDEIACPHCLEIDEEHCEYPRDLRRDGDKTEVDCSECGKRFIVSMRVEYTYLSEKGDHE